MFTDLSEQQKYMLNIGQQQVPTNHEVTHITPDNKLSEGIDSVERHMPAPWLPLVRYDAEFRTYVVISSQKPVAHATDRDGNQFIVPAGLALDAKAVKDAGGADQADTTAKVKYTALDVKNGVKNAKGEDVTEGEAVVKSFFDGADQKVFVSAFCGINNYNIFRHPGGDGINPALLNYYNYNPQPTISYNMDYAYQYAMVKDEAAYKKAPLDGISAFVGEKAMAGQFITYDVNSHFVLASEDFSYGSTAPEYIIGQVSKVVVLKDPTSGERTKNSYTLDHVVNVSPIDDKSGLNAMPGIDTNGVTAKVHYANGYGLISFSIQTR